MKIQRLQLWNFRSIEHLIVDFTQHTTAFVGVNGVGKSTVLDALAIVLSQLTWRLNDQPNKARPISPDDIRQKADFARIEVTALLRNHEVTWAVAKNRKEQKKGVEVDPLRKSDLEALNAAVTKLHAVWEHVEVERSEPYNLPLAVYYDVNRAVLEIPVRVREQLSHRPYEVYRDALDHGGADFKRFFIWFRNREDYENEQRRDDSSFRDHALEAVRAAVETFTAFRDLRIRRNPLRMTVVKQGAEFSVAQLSDGERNMLALVGDMARRLSILNPGLDNPNEGAGVVLIDEVDLHLHPRWQREVMAKLQTTFPQCQFIITSHSPQVLGELQPASIQLLKDGQLLGNPQASYGLNSGQVLEEIMEASSRTDVVKQQLAAVFSHLEHGALKEARGLIAELRTQAPSVPELGGAEALLKRKETLGR